MARPRRTSHGERPQADLFSIDPTMYLPMALADRSWPDPARFPVNHASSRVRQRVWGDLIHSPDPTVIAGFSSIGQLIELIAAWASLPVAAPLERRVSACILGVPDPSAAQH